MLDPAGPAARDIATLWWVMLAGAGAILVLVTVLVALAFSRKTVARDDAGMERTWIIGLGLGFSWPFLRHFWRTVSPSARD